MAHISKNLPGKRLIHCRYHKTGCIIEKCLNMPGTDKIIRYDKGSRFYCALKTAHGINCQDLLDPQIFERGDVRPMTDPVRRQAGVAMALQKYRVAGRFDRNGTELRGDSTCRTIQ